MSRRIVTPANFAWFIVSAFIAWLAVWRIRRYASTNMLDVPNQRSSHDRPTPRGGGLGVLIALEIGLIVLSLGSVIDLRSAVSLGLGGLAIGAVGFLDDMRGLPALTRFCVHLLAAAAAVWFLTSQPNASAVSLGMPTWLALGVLVLGVVWGTNLFNFMDGIDGIAASEAMFASSATAVLVGLHGEADGWVSMSLITAGASLGFLAWNWPPAKIFMGDVGSGFLGFWLAASAIALHAQDVLSIWTSIILVSVFIADATTTLLVRLSRGERIYQAHRSHVYQQLARRLRSHAKVCALVWLINILVAFPIAYLSIIRGDLAAWLSTGLILILAAVFLSLGAGRRSGENASPTSH